VLLQPFEHDRGIETARIGEHDLLDVFGHDTPIFRGFARRVNPRSL
jgi:hypothetical protein